ncbi:MAG: dTDP-4-dehydrorhamnose 3,5-epimerase [Lentisphaerae bacterium GWF2_45_14]|nr:MAG: dTDP-4-dehydrorhamnose 3,5-epimerase [Lentisphaerae bacterium GWF2_45_14]
MGNRFTGIETPLKGLLELHRKPVGDERGFFERLFCAEDMREFGHPGVIAQANRSLTKCRGAVRGMHFQYPPHGEWKLVTCLKGKVYDVAVDVRHNSPTFLKWHGIELSEDKHVSLLIPEGFAHGFQALTEDCEMVYFASCAYSPSSEDGLRPDDPALAINWPLPVQQMSERDAFHPLLTGVWLGVGGEERKH